MDKRSRLVAMYRRSRLAAVLLAVTLPMLATVPGAAAAPPAASRGPGATAGEAAAAAGAAASGPITVSGKVKPLNHGVELAIDPETGNGLAVWGRNTKQQGFGEIWAAELIRQGDGSYEAGKPFQVSTSSPAQRPTVEFLPEFGFYMILWDEGSRDPGATSGSSRIVSRLYVPTGTTGRFAAAGEFGPEVAMTDGDGTNLAPGLAYVGPSSIFERLIYSWWEMPEAASRSGARRPQHGPRKGFTDVTSNRETLRSAPQSFPAGAGDTPFANPLDTLRLVDGLPPNNLRMDDGGTCWLVVIVDLATNPLVAQFAVACTEPGELTGTWTLVGEPVMVPALNLLYGSIRPSGSSGMLEVVTNAGLFNVDPDMESSSPLPLGLNPQSFFMEFSTTSPLSQPSRAAAGDGLVSHEIAKGIFEYRTLDDDGTIQDPGTRLWKIKKKRLLDMDVEVAGDTVLVAWSEKKNKRGSKSTVKLGWFVPE